jgi:hypothetical protein
MGVITRALFVNEVSRPKDYRYPKSGFGVIVLAGCDVKACFLSASCNHSGSKNDMIAWQDCNLYNLLEVEKVLPEKYIFIGDEAFSNTQQFLSPWPGRGLDPYKDSFNYWLSHSRQAIKRAFGMLTQRFGIYWRMFRFSFDRWPLVIMVTMKFTTCVLIAAVTYHCVGFNRISCQVTHGVCKTTHVMMMIFIVIGPLASAEGKSKQG